MADPIPLRAPDGTVYAYACGRCKCPWQDDWTAGVCCTEPRCPACLCCVRNDGLCERCDADARRAFEALAAIGMAVAVQEYAAGWGAVFASGVPVDFDVLDYVFVARDALCGVDVAVVRRWR